MDFLKQYKLYIIVAAPLLIAVIIAIIIVSSNNNGNPSETTGQTTGLSDTSFTDGTTDTSQTQTGTGTDTYTDTQTEYTQPPETTTIGPTLPADVESDSVVYVSEAHNSVVIMSGTIKLPVFKNPTQNAVIAAVNSSVAALGDSYKAYVLGDPFNNAKIELAANGKIPFVFDTSYSVKLSSYSVLSLVMHHVEDFGGTHDSIRDRCYNYNMSTGSELKLFQVFDSATDVYMSKIYSYIEASIAQSPDSYYSDYKNLIRMYDYSNKWYFTENGLCVIFNPYQIAPYSAGIVRFTIPYSEFSGIMKINPNYMG